MTIKLLNTETELNSFPSSQSIFLLSSEELEETSFKDNIILFRLQSDNQLINLAEPYSYNLGYLKETFDRVELNFTTEIVTEGYKIKCKPVKLLNLDSTYCLYISDMLSSKYLTVSKLNSKSKSNISVKLKDNFNLKSTLSLKIEDTSYIINDKNIVRLTFDGKTQTLDVRSKNILLSNNVEITLEDTIYVKDEEFLIEIDPFRSSTENLQHYIYTVNSSSIAPIPKEEASTKISNLDILNFYNTLNNNKPKTIEKSIPKYLDHNVFSIKLPDGYTIDTSSSLLKSSINVAFNNYMLQSLNLYKDELKYIVNVYLDDFENEIIFELNYSEDISQTEKIIINFNGIDNL